VEGKFKLARIGYKKSSKGRKKFQQENRPNGERELWNSEWRTKADNGKGGSEKGEKGTQKSEPLIGHGAF
ncbi:MAG: hypothetical protein ACM3N7_10210, partial [Planctomycetaceae bacterium]